MSRGAAIARAVGQVEDGTFLDVLRRRVAIRTESQIPASHHHLGEYLEGEIGPELERMGYRLDRIANPVSGGGPFLIARREESGNLPTILTYGHGDVVAGLEGQWAKDRDPWTLDLEGDRIYGRGVADNKGQHTLNLMALDAVLRTRGSLGFNSVFFLETSEEIGSPGFHEVCEANRQTLTADVLIASDGPRVAATRPTFWLGSRGALNLTLRLRLRSGDHHSGNWGGLLANPGIVLAHAIASIVGPRGRVAVRGILPPEIPGWVRGALAGLCVDSSPGGPEVDPDWGEPDLTPAERVYGWNTFEVLAFTCGRPENPLNAIPAEAVAHCQIRFTADLRKDDLIPALRRHLDECGFGAVCVSETEGRVAWEASRTHTEDPWVVWAAESVRRTLGHAPVVVPNSGGSLPNGFFANELGMPTIYVPHSYPACSQHAPDEHGLLSVFREGIAIMAGLFWDAGEVPVAES